MLKIRRPKMEAPPAGMLGPDSVEVHPRRIRVGDTWCQTLAVTGFPREVGPGWLAPLLGYPGPIDVSLSVEPIPNDVAAGHLRRQRARFESTRRIESLKNRLSDPELDVAAADAAEMASAIARGEGRLFHVGLYITVRAQDPETLEAEAHTVRALAASLMLQCRAVTFRAMQGWISTLPIGIDALELRRTFDTRALAACFPFASAELNHSGGILYGRNLATGGLVFSDRFALENHNQVILARSGAGKSYVAKLSILRSLYQGIDVLVIDPHNEYERLARAVGGTVLRLGADGVRLNPLDLAGAGQPEALTEQALFVHSFVDSLLGQVSSAEKAELDRAILAAYERAGISADPRTHTRPAPLFADVIIALTETPTGALLAQRLGPFSTGSYRGMFDGATTVRPEGHLVVFSLQELSDEIWAAGALLALQAVWHRVTRGERKPRVVVIDEAWVLLASGHEIAARYLHRLAKAARKHWCGLTTITQDAQDVLATELGQAVVTNASTQILLGQSPQAIEALAKAFRLSAGEQAFLTSADQGQGLFCVGTERAAIQIIASGSEHALATSSPAEVLAMAQRP